MTRQLEEIGRYQITDNTTGTDSYQDDIIEAIRIADLLHYQMHHNVTILNRETGQTFPWPHHAK